MGRNHALAVAATGELDLAALCDLDSRVLRETAETVKAAATETGGPDITGRRPGTSNGPATYTDYAEMLVDARPDVVVIATPDLLHHPMAMAALDAGVRGIYCEKPIATNLKQAEEIVAACREAGVALAVGHQRRMLAGYRSMRELIAEGRIGRVELIRGMTSGSVLVDGTHAIDTALSLAGDPEVEWVVGQVFRGEPYSPEARAKKPYLYSGLRYGHVVEKGAVAWIQLSNGPRIELLCGEMKPAGRAYHDIEVFGSDGRIWKPGDKSESPFYLQDESGGYRPVDLPHASDHASERASVFEAFGRWARRFPRAGERPIGESAEDRRAAGEGPTAALAAPGDFPLGPENAMRGFQVVMSVYESARLRARVEPPIDTEEFPLQLLVDSGEL
jgi:predicted dehydrogenase